MPPLGLFEFSAIGVTLLVTGVLYVHFFGWRLIAHQTDQAPVETDISIRKYLSELVISAGAPQEGKMLRDSPLAALGIRVIEFVRHGIRFLPYAHSKLWGGNILIVSAEKETLKSVIGIPGIEIKPDAELRAQQVEQDDVLVAELLLGPQGYIAGRTLKEARFYERFSVAVLAVHRFGQTLRERLADLRLQVGDVLLVRGDKDRLDHLRSSPGSSSLNSLLLLAGSAGTVGGASVFLPGRSFSPQWACFPFRSRFSPRR